MRFADGAAIATERSLGGCEVCGRARAVQTHHRQPRGKGGVSGAGMAVNAPSCLLRVCLDCHVFLETRERGRAYDLGLLVRRPTVPATVPAWLVTAYGSGWWLLDDDGCYQAVDMPPPTLALR